MIIDQVQETIIGNVTLFESGVKESIGTERKAVKDCKTENERIEILRELFDINFSEEERNGIPPDRRLG